MSLEWPFVVYQDAVEGDGDGVVGGEVSFADGGEVVGGGMVGWCGGGFGILLAPDFWLLTAFLPPTCRGSRRGGDRKGSGSGGWSRFASGEAQVEATKGYTEGIFNQAMQPGKGRSAPSTAIVFVVHRRNFSASSFCLLPSAFCLLCPHFFGANCHYSSNARASILV